MAVSLFEKDFFFFLSVLFRNFLKDVKSKYFFYIINSSITNVIKNFLNQIQMKIACFVHNNKAFKNT